MQIFRKYGDFMNEKELKLPTQEKNHAPTEGNTLKKLQESHPITPLCHNKNEGNTDHSHQEETTQNEPEDKAEAEPPMFLHKIGGTTYKVAVHFDRQSKQTFKDKMERLLTHQLEENE